MKDIFDAASYQAGWSAQADDAAVWRLDEDRALVITTRSYGCG
ncbi:MAG: hypothetical protein U0V48_02935 [Anaerolineales bacterium]